MTFSNDIPSPLREGSIIVLRGSVGENPNGSFAIKFLVAKTESQAFHMDVRFSTKKVYRNSSVKDGPE